MSVALSHSTAPSSTSHWPSRRTSFVHCHPMNTDSSIMTETVTGKGKEEAYLML
ncbi:hypothetical protein E2C01_094605 [Portunus trituberculatus]|uniref:Uncharacterized protein n=1 Tax=Portunus trituberculatus TaxID=210409 RepID=A0A5B7JXB1_PORTR|nr:hypothetical protein [Portunus trituberculatus]